MANEITVSTTLQIIQGGVTSILTKSLSVTMVGSAKDEHSETYTTTAALVVISAAVIAEGASWFMVLNPDPTNDLLISLDNGTSFPHIALHGSPSGEPCGPFRLNVAPTVNPNIKIKTSAGTITNASVLILGR
jgi:hypothetical protein